MSLKHGLTTEIIFTQGVLDIEDLTQRNTNMLGENTQGKYNKVHLKVDSIIKLSEKTSFQNIFQFQHVLRGKNLDNHEDFSIGGVEGVKVFPSEEIVQDLSAENGYLYNASISYDFDKFQLSLFYDRGKTYMQKDVSGFKSKTVSDVGFGYYINHQNLFFKLTSSWKLDKEEVKNENRNYRLLGILGFVF